MQSDKNYDFDPWKFIGTYPGDVLDGDKTNDAAVEMNLQKVARLRNWKQHLQFGVLVDNESSICRINLGLGRGLTNWVSLLQMAYFLDESEFIKDAQDKHRLNLKRRHT